MQVGIGYGWFDIGDALSEAPDTTCRIIWKHVYVQAFLIDK